LGAPGQKHSTTCRLAHLRADEEIPAGVPVAYEGHVLRRLRGPEDHFLGISGQHDDGSWPRGELVLVVLEGECFAAFEGDASKAPCIRFEPGHNGAGRLSDRGTPLEDFKRADPGRNDHHGKPIHPGPSTVTVAPTRTPGVALVSLGAT
jgi:hypothetical protein